MLKKNDCSAPTMPENSSLTTSPKSEALLEEESVVSSLMNDTTTTMMEQEHEGPQLDLKSMDLVANTRRKEHTLLVQSFQRIQTASEAVWISGLSGTGKSRLAETLREPVTLRYEGFFVSGKFNQLRNEPYSALVEALSDLCDLVSQDKSTCEKLARGLEGDISVLSKVIPNLSSVIGTCAGSGDQDDTPTRSAPVAYHHVQANFTQLKLACRKFLNTIASRKHPIVILIDDLQWADKESLEVIESIRTDVNSKYVLLIGTYRSDHDAGPLLQILLENTTAEYTKEQPCLYATSIHLKNLDCDRVATLIGMCTSKTSRETHSLAQLVVKRTNGNPFFVVRFLELLQQNNLLTYDGDQWSWRIDEIQEDTIACDNVVKIVQASIQNLHHIVQSILRLAAVMGFTFDRGVLEAAIWQRTLSSSDNKTTSSARVSTQVAEALQIGEDRGLIESNADGTFRFCHDTFSCCLYAMTPKGPKVASAHLLLSRVMQKMENVNEPNYVFAIADQLNRGKLLIDLDDDRLNCAQGNLRAAKQALGRSAFELASEYAQHGLGIVNTSVKWSETNYTTILDLHCVAAEALYCRGNLDESNTHLEEVFEHAESLADVTRARVIRVHALGAHARLEEAIDVAFCGARAAGVKLIPKKPTMRGAICRLLQTKIMLRGKSDEQLLILPTVEEEVMKDVAFLLRVAAHYASVSMRIPHMIFAITTLIQLSLKGKNPVSSFCLYGKP